MRCSNFAIGLMTCVMAINPVHAETFSVGDWSGFYAGGGLGMTVGDGEADSSTTNVTASSYFNSASDVTQINALGDGPITQWRPSGGIYGGFSKQFGHMIVGIETSVNSLALDASQTRTVTYISVPTLKATLTQSYDADLQATLRLRLGYARENWLAYVSGDGAVTRLTVDTTFSDNNAGGTSGQDSNSNTKYGWTFGAGGEYLLSERWSVRGEYLYANFGQVDSRALVTPAFANLSNVLTNSIDLDTHTLSIGLTYRFSAF